MSSAQSVAAPQYISPAIALTARFCVTKNFFKWAEAHQITIEYIKIWIFRTLTEKCRLKHEKKGFNIFFN